MKTLKYTLLVAALAWAFIGCRKPVEVSFPTNAQEVDAHGTTLDVSLESNGDWSVASEVDWISVSPSSGSGNSTLALTVQPNSSSEARTGKITASTKDNKAVFTVTQRFENIVGNYISITPDLIGCNEEGGEFEVRVQSNIEWTVSEPPSWILCSETNGNGNGKVTVTVLPVEGELSASQEAILVIGNDEANATLHIVQSPADSVSITVTPEILEMACEGETKFFSVICEGVWIASCGDDWVSIDQILGEGDAEIAVTVGENPLFEPRQTQVKLTSSTGSVASVNVIQAASPDPHFLEVSPMIFHFGKEGGSIEITIGCDTEWKADLESSWASLSSMIGNGNSTITLTVAPNTITEPRSLSFNIVSDPIEITLFVTQEAGDEPIVAYFIPDTLSVPYVGGPQHLDLICNVSWSLESSTDWIILNTNTSGEGNASMDIIVDINGNESGRVGYVNILHDDQIIGRAVVVQQGKPNILETDISEIEVGPEGGEFVIHVTSTMSWMVNVDVNWITCQPINGLGNGVITITVNPMDTLHTRIGYVTLKGSTGIIAIVAVTQHQ